ncbi:MAG: STAS domain-containing protein [Nannocystaceae bacterium]
MPDTANPCLRVDLDALDRVRTPMWVVDLARAEKWWCNRAGLALWNATSLAEWIGRNARNNPSEATLTRMHNLRGRFERGEVADERWTFYPDGSDPVVADVQVSGIVIADAEGAPGRMAMLVEARRLQGDAVDPGERRAYEALRYSGELVSYYDETGAALLRNPAAIRAFGDVGAGDQLSETFADSGGGALLRVKIADGSVFRADMLSRTLAGERWFDTEARASLDPVTGKLGVLVNQRDIGERRAHVEELERRGQLLTDQAEALRLLAAPVIRVGPGILALPLIGTLDRERIEVAMAALVAGAEKERVRRVVLDLTGAAMVGAEAADGLLRIIRVLQLQGVTPALSGIRPHTAEAMVDAGIDLSDLRCYQTVADALAGRD